MNRTITILPLLLGIGTAATLPAADSRIYATITITTNPATGSNLVVNTATRSWTTNVTDAASQIEVTTGISEAQTNLFNHLASYPIGGSMALWGTSTNDVRLMAQVNSNLTVSFGGTWATVTYSTNYIERSYTVTVPYTAVTNLPYRTNMASALVDWISLTTTTTVPVTATAFEGYVNTNGNQTINGAKVFAGTINGTVGAVSNGTWLSPTTTNLTNYGAALVSAGAGANSLQLGENAVSSGGSSVAAGLDSIASGSTSIAIGASASGTNSDSIAIGGLAYSYGVGGLAIGSDSGAEGEYSTAIGGGSRAIKTNSVTLGRAAISSGSNSMALGTLAIADGNSAIAIGVSAVATNENAVAIGTAASATHVNSMALGNGATATSSNQVIFGNSAHIVSVPGVLSAGNITNAYLSGSNYTAGSWSTATASETPLDGANAMEIADVPLVTFAGDSLSSGIWTLDGLYPGWTGRKLRIVNLTGYATTLEHQSGLTATTNQFDCPGSVDFTWSDGYAVDLLYQSGRWRVLPSGSVPTTVGDLTVTGNITLTNTVYDDCVVALDARSGPAGAEPTFAAFAGPVFAWEFSGSASNALYFSLQLPHRYKHGSDLLPHIHWTKTTGTADAVIWGLDYVMASINSNFVTTATTIYTTNTCPTSMQHKIASFPTISGTNFSGSAVMMGKIYRLGDVDADTGTAWGLMLDVHYEADKLGSDSETP